MMAPRVISAYTFDNGAILSRNQRTVNDMAAKGLCSSNRGTAQLPTDPAKQRWLQIFIPVQSMAALIAGRQPPY
jgi:hypothetical protein